jgi:SAM-dependent methyltransferase
MTTELPTPAEMEELFLQKYGDPETTGWAPRNRRRFGYYLPADVYEATVARHVRMGCRWLDVGGGEAVFPTNAALARQLVSRCEKVTAVDPSENVRRNPFVTERVESGLEEYRPVEKFDLVTMRMVAEHVENPEAFARALAAVTETGGTVIILTVNRWSPVSIASGIVPFGLHHPIKRVFWGGEEHETFPVHYRMNTRAALTHVVCNAGFTLKTFARLDDLSVFGRFRILSYVELVARRGLALAGLPYPEQCLLAIFERNQGAPGFVPASRDTAQGEQLVSSIKD